MNDTNSNKFSIEEIPVKDQRGNFRVVKMKRKKTAEKDLILEVFKSNSPNFSEKDESTKKNESASSQIINKLQKKNEEEKKINEPGRSSADVNEANKNAKPSFVFHPEDEEEVAELVGSQTKSSTVQAIKEKEFIKDEDVEILNNLPAYMRKEPSKRNVDIDELMAKRNELEQKAMISVDGIISKLPDGILNKIEKGQIPKEKFKNLIKTRIKGARNNIKLWEALTRPINEGGMGLAENEADIAVKIISAECSAAEEADKSSSYDNKKDSSDNDSQAVGEKEEEVSLPSVEMSKVGEDKPFEEINQNVENEIKAEDNEAEDSSADAGFNFYEAKTRLARNEGKPKISDVKYKPKLLGPVGEIESLTVKDLRQMSLNPYKSVELIKSKIDALEEMSFAKKIEGMKAWRKSEIYKTYINLGRQAMIDKINIKEASNNLRAAQQVYLSEDEFNAITDLNKMLRF